MRIEDVDVKVEPVKEIYFIFLLDISASMSGEKYKNAFLGLKQLVQGKKGVIIAFGKDIHLYSIENVNVLEKIPLEGSTNLNGAIIRALNIANDEYKKGYQVMVNIFTDGGNNVLTSSYVEVNAEIAKAIALKMTVTFTCTDQDRAHVNSLYPSIDSSNIQSYKNDAEGVAKAMANTNEKLVTYSVNVSKGLDVTKGFYGN